MMEMACVSFNKVRLQYYLSKKERGAAHLSYLLKHPALLFGTTLVSINAALLIGSECSRRFFESVGASLIWAPLTQAFLVLLFAEIAPIFAGRRYAEHAVMIGVTPLYFFALILRPFIWLIDLLCIFIHKLIGSSSSGDFYLNREELQHIIEERKEKFLTKETDELNTTLSSIFSLKNKTSKELMTALEEVKMLPSGATLGDMRLLLSSEYVPFVPLFHKTRSHIVSIAYPRDFLRFPDTKKVKDHARSPWFVSESASILQIVKQFRKNNQSLAVVLSQNGSALGILTLDKIIDEIFGQEDHWASFGESVPGFSFVALDRAFPGDTPLWEFKKQYQIDLRFKNAKTLAQVMEAALGHIPREGETVQIDQFELTVDEASLLGPKSIIVRTVH
jgi:putative hemolysin